MDLNALSLADVVAFDLLDEMVHITDAKTQRILFVNRAERERTGVSSLAAESLTCHKMLAGIHVPCVNCCTMPLAIGEVRESQGYNPATKRHVYIKMRGIRLEGRLAHLVLSIDVSEIEQEKRALQNALEAQDMLGHTLHILAECDSLEKAYNLILQNLGETLRAKRAFVFELRHGLLYNTHEWCMQGVPSYMPERQGIDVSRFKHWLPIMEENRCILIPDVEDIRDSWREEYEMIVARGIHSYIVAPIRVRSKLVGYIGLDNPPLEKMQNIEPLLLSIAYYVSTRILMQAYTSLLEKMSFYDAMTGCGNRNAFMREKTRLENSRIDCSLGVAYFDLNNLKETNDTLGHEYGDRMIAQAGELFHRIFPAKEIYRVGGDEFVVLSVGEREEALLGKIGAMRKCLAKDDSLSISIGVAWEAHPKRVQDVIDRADQAMYAEKERYHREKAAREGRPNK
ncbi:MAG: diguanylate cyclase [Mitsuokella sp.]